MKSKFPNIDVDQLFREWLDLQLEVIALEKCLVQAGLITEDQLRQAREETKREAVEANKALQDSIRATLPPTKKGRVQ
jgi:hypothetical protein